jgi:hypothetical protein
MVCTARAGIVKSRTGIEVKHWSSLDKRRSRQCEVLLYFSEFATYRALAPECVIGLRKLVCSLRFVPPFLAHLRSNPNNLPTAGLNRLDGVDGIYIKRVGLGLEIDGPPRTASYLPHEFGT